MGTVIAGLVLVGFLLLVAIGLLRVLLSVVGLGPWACRKGWHWDRDFLLHTKQGLTSRTHSYLAVAGIRINQCRTCGRFSPPEGQVVYEQWRRGGVQTVGGGIFTSPKMKVDTQAAQAIGATLAQSIAVAPPRPAKPEVPPARWMVVVGSSPIVQRLGIFVVVGAFIAAVGCLVGCLDAKPGEGPVLFVTALGLAVFAWLLTKILNAGMGRYACRKNAAEAARDPDGYYKRSVELARERGVEVAEDLTPEVLAAATHRRAERE